MVNTLMPMAQHAWAIIRKSLETWVGLQAQARTPFFIYFKGVALFLFKKKKNTSNMSSLSLDFGHPVVVRKSKQHLFCQKNLTFNSFQHRNASSTSLNTHKLIYQLTILQKVQKTQNQAGLDLFSLTQICFLGNIKILNNYHQVLIS